MRRLSCPAGKLGLGNYFVVFTANNANYFQLTGLVSADSSGNYSLSDALTPQQALYLDGKIDDGSPLNGKVTAVGGTGPVNMAATPGAGSCVSNAGGNPYNTSSPALASAMLCQLKLAFN